MNVKIGSEVTSRKWRTLVRVENVDGLRGIVEVTVPAYDPTISIPLPISQFGVLVRPELRNGGRLYARVNIGAVNKEDLQFEDWTL